MFLQIELNLLFIIYIFSYYVHRSISEIEYRSTWKKSCTEIIVNHTYKFLIKIFNSFVNLKYSEQNTRIVYCAARKKSLFFECLFGHNYKSKIIGFYPNTPNKNCTFSVCFETGKWLISQLVLQTSHLLAIAHFPH